ncbi:phosphate/phosphite/phosphonate ABC transporter substrate-binding protein [Marinobacterium jannaschii]|uniref:phosphate/phosphite/phosphonate ABC transporter substrate-binding protein n=1 Tax=Marinobacterium jannaschii TaxID=64970 RepID=UPI0006861ECF|nr:phosphate/phosphite/phosphonate ABC transporter substrate-binding protein [Marinobacterium jannaschii]
MLKPLLLTVGISLIPGIVDAETLTLGVVPQQSAKKLARLWTPVLIYLSEKSGHQIRFATAKDIPTFEKRLANSQYDLSYMNPYHYTVFHRSPGYVAFANQKDKKIKGIMVVAKDSEVSSLQQLEGQGLAFPSPAAFAASVLPRARLNQDRISVRSRYVGSHDSVYLGVARGFFTAGGGVMRTFNNTAPEVRDKLRVLWTTDTYTPHAFAAHPRVSSETVAQVRQAMLDMTADPEGLALLKSLNFKGFQRASNEDWDDVRSLGLDLLDGLIRNKQ